MQVFAERHTSDYIQSLISFDSAKPGLTDANRAPLQHTKRFKQFNEWNEQEERAYRRYLEQKHREYHAWEKANQKGAEGILEVAS